ncbi:hypothetical protein GUITHDRAFT_118781 [Guillardia theta CCMP2712]|uniref:Uncharacterized protein n=1 Tax=Guillardia theta (strain CCMP2712) TaxID=905079 RepID=L1IFL7_GUITC|nr:hypothetical protein GUITHDRAFT_118781 [Guillardia theta CCMP2712]EKX35033.1 hypothetical protein GUITHDRAFT_118781 [Guillardia theta CCMP2712]|eukprot:XP_005822013.1 hypothetical protein GUITHDRAFT_118781 [Guillardia theta CCMP2712]
MNKIELGVAASFTISSVLKDSITFWLKRMGLCGGLQEAGYDLVIRELFVPDAFAHGTLNVALLHLPDWLSHSDPLALEGKLNLFLAQMRTQMPQCGRCGGSRCGSRCGSSDADPSDDPSDLTRTACARILGVPAARSPARRESALESAGIIAGIISEGSDRTVYWKLEVEGKYAAAAGVFSMRFVLVTWMSIKEQGNVVRQHANKYHLPPRKPLKPQRPLERQSFRQYPRLKMLPFHVENCQDWRIQNN